MHKRLSHKQTAVMLTLMALAREVSNPELHSIAGLVLDGKDRLLLNNEHYVASRKKGRSYSHELTDRGWGWCGEELASTTPPPPPPRSTLSAAMYVVLDSLSAYLRRENLSPADVFAPPAELAAEPSAQLTAGEIETRIRTAYRKLARSPKDWVGLVDLRPLLGDAPAEDVDAVLRELSRTGEAHLVPESNRKALTAADHAAAIRIGGEANHLLSIEAS